MNKDALILNLEILIDTEAPFALLDRAIRDAFVHKELRGRVQTLCKELSLPQG